MMPLQKFDAYRDAVETSATLLQCKNNKRTERFYCRTLAAYTAAKGMDYADEVAGQVSLLLAGVDALRRETT